MPPLIYPHTPTTYHPIYPHTQRTFNHHLSTLGLPPCYHYIVAGGDSALVKSVEATEDSWQKGVRALEEVGGWVHEEGGVWEGIGVSV